MSQVGSLINVQGVGSSYDGLFPVNSFPALNQATYVVTASNITSAAVSPNGSAIINSGVTVGGALSNVAITNYTAIVTTGSAHGLAIGDIVAVNTGQSGANGVYVVTAVPSTTLFCFASTVATLASTALTQGAFGKFPVNYTFPALTSGIITNAVFANPTTNIGTVDMIIDGIAVAKQLSVAANSSVFLDIKQYAATGKTFTVGSNLPQIDVQVSGLTIV